MLAHGRGYEVDVLGGWTFDPLTVVLLLALGLAYALGVRRARPHTRPTLWQRLAFTIGLATAAVALTSPLARLSDDLFVAHMAQHTLLTSMAVPMMLLGIPFVPLLTIIPRPARRGPMRRIALFTPARAMAHVFRHPLAAGALYILVTLAWHVPAVYGAAIESEALHAVQHLSFVATAALFWMQVIDPLPFHAVLPAPVRLLYIFAAGLPHHLLTSSLLVLSPRPLYPIYADTTAAFGMSPLSDQQLAGGVMAAGSLLVTLVAFTVLFFLWLDREEREQRAREGRAAALVRTARRAS